MSRLKPPPPPPPHTWVAERTMSRRHRLIKHLFLGFERAPAWRRQGTQELATRLFHISRNIKNYSVDISHIILTTRYTSWWSRKSYFCFPLFAFYYSSPISLWGFPFFVTTGSSVVIGLDWISDNISLSLFWFLFQKEWRINELGKH